MRKLIKLIIRLAIILAIFIFIVYLLINSKLINKLVFKDANNKEEKVVDITTYLKDFEIELSATKLNISVGNKFEISTNNDNLEYEEDDGKFEISEKKNLLLKITKANYILNITVPSNDYLNFLEIEAGAGSVEIEDLTVMELDLTLGAGVLVANNVKATDSSSITGGTGSINLNDCEFNNLKIKSGASETDITSILNGNTIIESGLGNFNLTIPDSKDKYAFKIKKGAGDITIDDETITESTYGSGNNLITIKSGIGNFEINFK